MHDSTAKVKMPVNPMYSKVEKKFDKLPMVEKIDIKTLKIEDARGKRNPNETIPNEKENEYENVLFMQ